MTYPNITNITVVSKLQICTGLAVNTRDYFELNLDLSSPSDKENKILLHSQW